MPEPQPHVIHALELGPMENFVYLIEDRASGRAAIVDPAWDVPQVLALARQRGVRVTDILLTHSHHDHINGIDEVLRDHDAQLHLLKAEARFWGSYLPPCITVVIVSVWVIPRLRSCIHPVIRRVRPVTASQIS
jgi:glyoxylase-like metal-dependent hydrolase (beta-lactamase superfamily II)